MIVYNRIDKVIIIPECGCPSSGAVPHSKCEREVQIAYASGYTAGLEDCSGGTGCELQEGRLVLREDWLGPETIYPDLTHNGFDKFVVIDNGYGQEKWYEGYEAGIQDCSGHTDCTSAITEAYQEGYQSGATHQKQMLVSTAFTQNGEYTRENGWSSVTVNVPNAANLQERTYALSRFDAFPVTIYPISGYDGMSKLTLNDADYSQYIYQSGYSAGLADASGVTLKADVFSLNASWQGDTTFYPSRVNADGFSRFRIYDNGYANHWRKIGQEEGFSSGFTSGVTSGFSAGFESASTREMSLYFHFPIGQGNFVDKNTSNIIINSNSGTQLTYLELTGNMDVYEAKFLTTENSATTIELWLNYNYPDHQYEPVVVDQFTSIKAYDLYDVPIITQTRDFVEETDTRIKYKYTFTVDTTPFYNRDAYEAGLAACQNNE